MLEVVIYFAGPRTLWTGKIADEEVIMRKPARWLWIARMLARDTHARLDQSRCGYVIMRNGEVLEHVEPNLVKPAGPAPIEQQLAEMGIRTRDLERIRSQLH